MNEKNRWLTPKDLELEFGILRQTQAKLRVEGRLPYSKLGTKIVRYDRLKINELFEDNAVVISGK